MIKIDRAILKGKECDNLLRITNEQLSKKLEVIDYQDQQIKDLKKINTDKDTVVMNKEAQIKEFEKNLKKESRKKNWLKIGWGTSVLVLITLLVLKT